jgi:hypothetical protein
VRRGAGRVRGEGYQADRALALTFFTLVLLTPPILLIFDVPIFIFGIPLLHIYCFGVWLIAIAFGALLSTRLKDESAGPQSSADSDGRG